MQALSKHNLDWGSANPRLERREFELFRRLIRSRCGIKVSDSKVLLLQNRIGKRLRALGIPSFKEYYRLLSTPAGKSKELCNLWAAITTNETHFFREPHHFEVLRKNLLPEMVVARSKARMLRVWSAGCSTGQEVYTLAMVLDDWLAHHQGWRFSVFGSDIDKQALAIANVGTYPQSLRHEVPGKHLVRYFETDAGEMQVKPELRGRVHFRRQNLAVVLPARPRVDLIFCRNAMMYLEKATRARLVQVFWDSLLPGGYLIVGSSESLHGLPRLFEAERMQRTLVHRKPLLEERQGGND